MTGQTSCAIPEGAGRTGGEYHGFEPPSCSLVKSALPYNNVLIASYQGLLWSSVHGNLDLADHVRGGPAVGHLRPLQAGPGGRGAPTPRHLPGQLHMGVFWFSSRF